MKSFFILFRICILTLLSVIAHSAHGQAITLGASPLEAYKPFSVNVTFASSHCINPRFPLVAQSSYKAGEYSLVLSHVKAGPCRNTFDLVVPGLPFDAVSLRVSVTRSPEIAGTPAVIAESVVRPLTIGLPVGMGAVSRMYTARVESDGVFDPFSAPTGSGVGPVVLWPFTTEPLTGAKWFVEANDQNEDQAYTFKYFKRTGSSNPAGLASLYSIQYPVPLRGIFYTTEVGLADELARAWGRSVTSVGLVGKLEQGSCPVGMSPVFQTFYSGNEVSHRYTQRPDIYRALIANGYAGEGPKWCAPER